MTYRSGTPLIYRAVPAWFVRVTPIVDDLVKNNQETLWSALCLCVIFVGSTSLQGPTKCRGRQIWKLDSQCSRLECIPKSLLGNTHSPVGE